jgi:hypothetical protein
MANASMMAKIDTEITILVRTKAEGNGKAAWAANSGYS